MLKLQQRRVLSSEDSESFSEQDDDGVEKIYSRHTNAEQEDIKESLREVFRQYEVEGVSKKKHRLLLGVTKNHPERFKEQYQAKVASKKAMMEETLRAERPEAPNIESNAALFPLIRAKTDKSRGLTLEKIAANDATNVSSNIQFEQVNKDYVSRKGELNQIKPIEVIKTFRSKNNDINDNLN